MSLNETVRREQAVWAAPDSLEFYRTHRNRCEDLYDSERFYLPEILSNVRSVLDVGCAAGGFSRIMHTFNPSIRYVGTDIIPEFVAIARKDFPDSEFHVSDGIHFPFPAGSFELVHCSGVLHVNSSYGDMVRAMWAQTSRYLLCDFRLTRGPSVKGEVKVKFDAASGGQVLPYLVLNADEIVSFLKSLSPRPGAIRGRGYQHVPTSTARVPLETVIMAFFLLEKGNDGPLHVDISLDDNK
jgi:SAM-dependent methyltransferase